MRVSSDEHDPGYAAWADIRSDDKHVRVLLDGVEQHECVVADTDLGLIVRYKRSPFHGQLELAADGNTLIREVVRGQVKLEIRS